MKICHIFYNGQQDYLESGNEADEPTPQEVLAVRIRLGQNFRWSFCDAPLALGLCLTDAHRRKLDSATKSGRRHIPMQNLIQQYSVSRSGSTAPAADVSPARYGGLG